MAPADHRLGVRQQLVRVRDLLGGLVVHVRQVLQERRDLLAVGSVEADRVGGDQPELFCFPLEFGFELRSALGDRPGVGLLVFEVVLPIQLRLRARQQPDES